MTKNDKIVAVVRCSKFREFLKVLLWHYVKGHKWKDGSSSLSLNNLRLWFLFKANTAISLSDSFVLSEDSFFLEHGVDVSSFEEFQNAKTIV